MTIFKTIWRNYTKHVRIVMMPHAYYERNDISFWRNELFCNMITYLLPVSFIALVPGVYMSFLNGIPFLAICDLFIFTCIAAIALRQGLSLKYRKFLIIFSFYCLSVVLLYYLSILGPGMIYLLAITIITAIVVSSEAAYYTVLVNLFICILFGLLIRFGLITSLFSNYDTGSWIAVSSNLIVLSLVCTIGINRLINGLEKTISERKEAEAELVFSNKELLKTMNEVRDYKYAIVQSSIVEITNSKGKIIFANDNFCKLSGYTLEELHGQEHRMMNSGYHPKSFYSELWNTVISGKIWKGDVMNKAKNGNLFWVDTVIVPFIDEDGMPYQYMVFRKNITDRKKSEEKIRISNQILEGIINTIPVRVFWKDENLNYLGCNIGFANDAGFSDPKDLIGKDDYQMGWYEQANLYRADDKSVIERGSAKLNIEEPSTTPEGNKITLLTSKIPLLDPTGKITGVLGTYMDITDRKKAEENLRQNELRMKEAEAIAHLGNWQLNFATGIVTWSDEACQIYGIPIAENIQTFESWISFLHPEDLDYVMKITNEAQKTLSDSDFEHRILLKDGTIKYVQSVSKFLFDPNDKPLGLNGIVQDITERKKIEKELLLSESKFRKLFEQAGVGVAQVQTSTGSFVKVNKKFANMLGYSIDELLLLTFKDITHPDDIKESLQNQSRLLRKQIGEFSIEKRYLQKNGTLVWATLTASSMGEIDGGEDFQIAVVQDITERKKAEETLIQSEARLKEAQALAKVGNWETDLSTLKVIWSAETFRIFELNADNFQSSHPTFLEFVHPDDRAKVDAAFVSSFDKDSINLIEHRIVTPTGTEKIVEERWQIFHNNQGYPSRAVGTCQDITERKIVQESQNLFRTLIDNSNDSIEVINPDTGRFIDGNEKAWFNLGYTREEFLTLSVPDIDPMVNPSNFKQVMEELRKSGVKLWEGIHLKKDGSTFPVEVNLQLVQLDREYLVTIVRDVTERKKSEDKIKKSEERYRQIVETTHEAIWRSDENNLTVFVNKRFSEMFGYSFEEMMGKTDFDLLDDEGKAIVKEKIEQRKKGISEDYEQVFITKSGQRIWTNISASPFMDNNGNYRGAIAMLTDINEQKKSEKVREKMNADILQRNQNLEQFSYIISHNLRSPVAHIMGLTQLMNASNHGTEEHSQMIGMLSTAVNNLDTVIKDLNYILQVKQEVTEKKEMINFSELVSNIKVSISNMIKNEQVDIKTDFSEVNSILSIKSYVYSIFYNLITNSIKYRQPSIIPEIEITSFRFKNKIMVVLKDNGLGMDLNKNGDKIFGLYKRFHTHTDGKGMGLFMVKTQVETLGGKISVQSELNKGTEFKIEFEEEKIIQSPNNL